MVAQRAERRAYRHQCVSQWGEKAAAFKCVVPWSIHCQWRNTCCRWRHKRDGSGHKWGWKGVNALWLRCRPWGPRAASRRKLLHTNWSSWFCYALPKSSKALTAYPLAIVEAVLSSSQNLALLSPNRAKVAYDVQCLLVSTLSLALAPGWGASKINFNLLTQVRESFLLAPSFCFAWNCRTQAFVGSLHWIHCTVHELPWQWVPR